MGDACSKNKSKQVKQLNFEFQSPLQILRLGPCFMLLKYTITVVLTPKCCQQQNELYSLKSLLLSSTAPHLSSMLPVHTGTSSTRRKSFLSWKHSEIREVEGHQHVGPTISCCTNTPALSWTAHEAKRNRGHAELYTDLHFGCTSLDIEGVP